MEKVKITNVNIAWANKEGAPYLSKFQKPYARVGIQTEQHGKKWLSGFAYQGEKTLTWKSGDEVEIEIKPNGDYLNFSVPKATAAGIWTPELIEKLFTHLREINEKLDSLTIDSNEDEIALQNPPIDNEDIPF